MAGNPAVVVDFIANTKSLKAGVAEASGATSGFSTKLRSLAKAGALAAGAAGVGALIATVKIGIDEWQQSTKVAAQTAAVLKSTGGVANVTAQDVGRLAEAIMKKTGIDDEAIASGENLLLTFTNIRNETGKGNDIFTQATRIMADMSVALGQDMKSSAIQLGKALNNPIKGVTALQRVGVSFTQAQKDQIKQMVESGHTMDAQKLILAELNREFAGSAEAAGKTLPGQLSILRQEFNNFAGDLIGKLAPALQASIAWLQKHWPEISAVISSTWAIIEPLIVALGDLVVAVVQLIADNWGTIGPIVMAQVRVLQAGAKVIGDVLRLITALLRGDWAQAWQLAKQVVVDMVAAVKAQVTAQLLPIKMLIEGLWNAIVNATSDAWGSIRQAIVNALTAIGNKVDVVESAVTSSFAAIRSAFSSFSSWVGGVVTTIVNAVGRMDNPFHTVAQAAESMVGDVKRAINDLVGWLGDAVGRVSATAGRMAGAIKAPINAVIGAWNSLAFTIPKIEIPSIKIAGHKIGGGGFGPITFPFPDVPYLATGGVVTGPTLAMLGEAGPELVLPLSGQGAIEVRVFIGDTELRGLVRTEVHDVNAGVARTLIAGSV